MSIHENTINEKLIKEGCIVPNCNQRKFVRTAESKGRRKPVCMFCFLSLPFQSFVETQNKISSKISFWSVLSLAKYAQTRPSW